MSTNTKTALPATQYSADGKMALVPSRSPFNAKELWWSLSIKSPVHGGWVSIQGGSSGMPWMRELGFKF